jgi:hypothetical protein
MSLNRKVEVRSKSRLVWNQKKSQNVLEEEPTFCPAPSSPPPALSGSPDSPLLLSNSLFETRLYNHRKQSRFGIENKNRKKCTSEEELTFG